MSSPTWVIPSEEHAMCPTALFTGAWQLYVLTILYVLNGLAALYEVARGIGKNYGIYSFRSGFLLISCLFMMYRALLVFVPLGPWRRFPLAFLVLSLPLFLQFVLWSLLILFLAKALYVVQGKQERVRTRLYPAYGVLVTLSLCSNVAIAAIVAIYWDPQMNDHEFDKTVSVYAAGSFGLIVMFVFVYGLRTYRLLASVALSETRRRRNLKYFGMITFYWVIFVIRTIWNVLYFVGANPLQEIISIWNASNDATERSYYYTSFLIWYGIMEVLPMTAVVLTIRTLLPRHQQREAREEYGAAGESLPLNR